MRLLFTAAVLVTLATGVAPAAAQPPVFGDYLYGVFMRGECLHCHAFGNPASVKRREHDGLGRTTPATVVTDASKCWGCHRTGDGYVDGWQAPGPHDGMDWTGRTAPEVCAMIRAQHPEPARMRRHLQADPLGFIPWALERMGIAAEWRQRVDAWIEGGMACR